MGVFLNTRVSFLLFGNQRAPISSELAMAVSWLMRDLSPPSPDPCGFGLISFQHIRFSKEAFASATFTTINE